MSWTGKPVTSSLPNQRFHRHSRIQSQIHFPGHFLRVFSMLSTIWVFDKLRKVLKFLRNQKTFLEFFESVSTTGRSIWVVNFSLLSKCVLQVLLFKGSFCYRLKCGSTIICILSSLGSSNLETLKNFRFEFSSFQSFGDWFLWIDADQVLFYCR